MLRSGVGVDRYTRGLAGLVHSSQLLSDRELAWRCSCGGETRDRALSNVTQ